MANNILLKFEVKLMHTVSAKTFWCVDPLAYINRFWAEIFRKPIGSTSFSNQSIAHMLELFMSSRFDINAFFPMVGCQFSGDSGQ